MPIAIAANGLVLVQFGTDPDFPFAGDGLLLVDLRDGGERRLADQGPIKGVGVSTTGLVAFNAVTAATYACPDTDVPDRVCPVLETAVWDSGTGEITRLPGWSGDVGPNAYGAVVVERETQLAVWHSSTGVLVPLEGLDAPSPRFGWPVAINDHAQVVGADSTEEDMQFATDAGGITPGRSVVVWDGVTGDVVDLEYPGSAPGQPYDRGARNPHPVGIDASGRVAAYAQCSPGCKPPANSWDPASRSWTSLPGAQESTYLWALSGGGMLVGTDQSGIVVWDLARGVKLELSIPALDIGGIEGIDDAGDILASGYCPCPNALVYRASTGTWSYIEG